MTLFFKNKNLLTNLFSFLLICLANCSDSCPSQRSLACTTKSQIVDNAFLIKSDPSKEDDDTIIVVHQNTINLHQLSDFTKIADIKTPENYLTLTFMNPYFNEIQLIMFTKLKSFIHLYSISQAAMVAYYNTAIDGIEFDENVCAAPELNFFITSYKGQILKYNYVTRQAKIIDPTKVGTLIFKCFIYIQEATKTYKLVIAYNNLDLNVYEGNFNETIELKNVYQLLLKFNIEKMMKFNGNRLAIQTYEGQFSSYYRGIDLNIYKIEIEFEINRQSTLNYSFKHLKWFHTFGSGQIYINNEYYDFQQTLDSEIDVSDSVNSDTFDSIFAFQGFHKIAINKQETEITLVSISTIYVFKLPDMQFITAKKTTKYVEDTKNKNYLYTNNIFINFLSDNMMVFDTARSKQIFDNSCLVGNQMFNEYIKDIYIDTSMNRLIVLDLFGSAFFVKYNTGEPYHKFASLESKSNMLILKEENLIILWSISKVAELLFLDYQSGNLQNSFYQLQSEVIFSCYYPKVKVLVVIDTFGDVLVLSITQRELVQMKRFNKIKKFSCNVDKNSLFFLRTDDNVIEFIDLFNLNNYQLVTQLKPYALNSTQFQYINYQLFMITAFPAYPYVLIQFDLKTKEIRQTYLKCVNPLMNISDQNYFNFICEDRVFILGITNTTNSTRSYLKIPEQYQKPKIVLIDDTIVLVVNYQGNLLEYDLETGELIFQIELHSSYEPRTVFLDKESRMLISGGSEGRIIKYSYEERKIAKLWKSLDVSIIKLDLENRILIHSSQSYLYARNYDEIDVINTFKSKPPIIKHIDISDDDEHYSLKATNQTKLVNGLYVFSEINIIAGYGDSIYLWDYLKMTLFKTINGINTKTITCFEYLKHIDTIVSASEDSVIALYQQSTFTFASNLVIEKYCNGVTVMGFTVKTNVLIVGCQSGSIFLYQINPQTRKLELLQSNLQITDTYPFTRIIVDEDNNDVYMYSNFWTGSMYKINYIIQGKWNQQIPLYGIYGEVDIERQLIVDVDKEGAFVNYQQIHNGKIWDLKLVQSQGQVITAGEDKTLQVRVYTRKEEKAISTYLGKYQFKYIVYDELANVVLVTDSYGGILLLEYPQLFLKQEFRQSEKYLIRPVVIWQENVFFTGQQFQGEVSMWNYEGFLRDTFIFESRSVIGIVAAQRNIENSSEVYYLDNNQYFMKWNSALGTRSVIGVLKDNPYPIRAKIFQVPSQNSLIFADISGIYHFQKDNLQFIQYAEQKCIDTFTTFTSESTSKTPSTSPYLIFCKKQDNILIFELIDKVNFENFWQIVPPRSDLVIENIDSPGSTIKVTEADRTVKEKQLSYIDLFSIDPASNLIFYTLPATKSIVAFNYQLKKYIYKKSDHSKIITNFIEDFSKDSTRRRLITYGWDGNINIYQFDKDGKKFSLLKSIYLCNPDYMEDSQFVDKQKHHDNGNNNNCLISSVSLSEDYLIAYTFCSFNNVKVFSYPDLTFKTSLQSPTNGYTLLIKTSKKNDMLVLASSFHYLVFSYKTLELKYNIRNLQAFTQYKISNLVILSKDYILSQFSLGHFLIKVDENSLSSKQIQQFREFTDTFDRFSFNVNADIKEDGNNLSIQMTTANSNSMTEFLFVIKGTKQCQMEFQSKCNQHCIKQQIRNIESFNILSKSVYRVESFNFIFNLSPSSIISDFPPFEFSLFTNLTYQSNAFSLQQSNDGENEDEDDSPSNGGLFQNTDATRNSDKTIDDRQGVRLSPRFAASVANINSLTLTNMLIDASSIINEQNFNNITSITFHRVELTKLYTNNLRYFIFEGVKNIKLSKMLIQNQIIKRLLIFQLVQYEKAIFQDITIINCPMIQKATFFELAFYPQNNSTQEKEFYLDGMNISNNTNIDGSIFIKTVQLKITKIGNVNFYNNKGSSSPSTFLILYINKNVELYNLNYEKNTDLIHLISQNRGQATYKKQVEIIQIFEDVLNMHDITVNGNTSIQEEWSLFEIESGNFTIYKFNATSNQCNQGGVILIQTSRGTLDKISYLDNVSTHNSNLIIQGAYIKMTNSNFTRNKGYSGGAMYIAKTEIQLSNSIAIQNEATDGGVMYIKDSYKNSKITKVEFKDNSSSGSGGCLVLDNSDVDLVENNFHSNRAEIGGAVRYINLQPTFMRKTTSRIAQEAGQQEGDLPTTEFLQDSCGSFSKNTCVDNQGKLFGKNIGSYVSKIVQVENDGTQMDKNEFKDNLFKDIRSGQNEKKIVFQLLDEFDQKVDFSTLDLTTISPNLAEELKLFTTKLEAGNKQKNQIKQNNTKTEVQIDGNVLQDYFNGQFIFDQYSIEGKPDGETLVRLDVNPVHILHSNNHTYSQGESIILNVTFRSCQIGEIPLKSCPNCSTISCQECPQGTYSLEDPSTATACMKCDYKTSSQCFKNVIKLKEGFWRENSNTDEIHYCLNFPQSCNGDESKNYCAPGFIGPLCETCDYEGTMWGERYGRSSLGSNHIDSCQKCEDLSSQYIYFALSVVGIIVFVFLTIYEINRQQVNKVILSLIHRTGMQVMGNSANNASQKTQLTKLFIHHILILTTLQSFNFDIRFLDWFQLILSPFMFMNSSLDCILYDMSKGVLPLHYARLLYFNLLILFLLLVTYVAFKILFWIVGFSKNNSEMISVHAYLNSKNSLISLLIGFTFIFQQDIIYSLFAVSSCRQIGEGYYISSHLIENCYTKTYYTYTLSIVLPFLLVWAVILPAIVYFKIKSFQNKSPTFTNSMRQVGFLTSDYKKQHSHWELFKIYIRIFIVCILNFLHNNSFRKGFYISIILMAYLQQLQSKKPYLQKEFQDSDQYCTIIEIFIMWLLVYNEASNNEIESNIIIVVITLLSSYIALFLFGKVVREIIMGYLQSQQDSKIKHIINKQLDNFGIYLSKSHPKIKLFIKQNLFSFYTIIYQRQKITSKKLFNWKNLRKQYLDFKRRKQDDQNASFYSEQNNITSNLLIRSVSSSSTITPLRLQNQMTSSQKMSSDNFQTNEIQETCTLKSSQMQMRIQYLKNQLEKKRKFESSSDIQLESNQQQTQNSKENQLVIFEETSQILEDKHSGGSDSYNPNYPSTNDAQI